VGCVGQVLLDSLGELLSVDLYCFRGREGGEGDGAWLPRDRIGDAFPLGGPYPSAVASVMGEGGTKVPCIDRMWSP
jgi:hypothetical protein